MQWPWRKVATGAALVAAGALGNQYMHKPEPVKTTPPSALEQVGKQTSDMYYKLAFAAAERLWSAEDGIRQDSIGQKAKVALIRNAVTAMESFESWLKPDAVRGLNNEAAMKVVEGADAVLLSTAHYLSEADAKVAGQLLERIHKSRERVINKVATF